MLSVCFLMSSVLILVNILQGGKGGRCYYDLISAKQAQAESNRASARLYSAPWTAESA